MTMGALPSHPAKRVRLAPAKVSPHLWPVASHYYQPGAVTVTSIRPPRNSRDWTLAAAAVAIGGSIPLALNEISDAQVRVLLALASLITVYLLGYTTEKKG